MNSKQFTFLRTGYARILSVLMLFALTISVTSCDDDDDNSAAPTQNIVALAQGNSELSSLVSALVKYPDLVTTLSGNGKFTVFAPTNDAFDALLEVTGQSSIDDLPEDVLRSVLEYHVVAGATVLSSDLSTGDVETVLGEDIAVNVSSGVKLNSTVNVAIADVKATNGVVHVIDAVLVPPSMLPIVGTIVAPAYFNKNFTTLVAAVVQADLLETLIDADADFTLFAPTNEAFAAAGITALPPDNESGNALLTSILTYHVIDGSIAAGQLPVTTANTPASVQTLGGKFFLTNRGSGVFINGNTEVVATDIEGSNGIVHVINRTLVPPSKTIAQIAIDYSTASAPQFTQLVAALSKVPALLNAASDASANLTVFAPTDQAFQQLYTALGVSNIDELEAEIGNAGLAKVLQHHIVGAQVFSSDLASGSVPTLNQNINVNVTNLTITDGSSSNPAAGLVPSLLNVKGTNGVIHVIDKVLLPTL